MLLVGPFSQLLTLDGLNIRGQLSDSQLEVVEQAGILIENKKIKDVGDFRDFQKKYFRSQIFEITKPMVAAPGFIDAHTHLCFAGSRHIDFAMRNAGKSYLEINQEGGGIWDTVLQTRNADIEQLASLVEKRISKLIKTGVTTVEIKSGYGLSIKEEIKILNAINIAKNKTPVTIVPTCLAAHLKPRDFDGSNEKYLQEIIEKLVPVVKEKKLCRRFDIFIEQGAFTLQEADLYLKKLVRLGFQLTVHADQFSPGGSKLAIRNGALSVDHLEASTEKEIDEIAKNQIVAVALPGASVGLGEKFAPARRILDKGGCLAIASDWNPGSAPMGNLLLQASVLACYEKLTTAETLAGLTIRAAKALGLKDRGVLKKGKNADFIAFPCSDYREIFYHQGQLLPEIIWIKGNRLSS